MSATVSVKDVAARAGLSVGTVSNVLNRPDKVSRATRDKVMSAIDELGFVRNEAARQLRAGMSHCVGVIVLNSSNPFFNDVAASAEAWAADRGISVLVGNSAEMPERERDYLDLFEQQRVRGVLLSPVGSVGKRLHRMRDSGIATVLVDRDIAGDFSCVSVDDKLGGRLAMQHLVDMGRRRVAFVGGPLSLSQVADRFAGAAEVAGDHAGVTLEFVSTDRLTLPDGRVAGEKLLARPAAGRPDALFGANDLVALGLLQAITGTRALRVPDDIALIGYDDIAFAAGAAVPLTSIAQPRFELGRLAMDLLLKEADDPSRPFERIVLQPELIARASTDPTLGLASVPLRS